MIRPSYALLAATVAAFLLWHMPLRGPLSDEEIDTALTSFTETAGAGWASAEDFERFLRNDDGRPFVMINLVELRDAAAYPDGHALASEARTGAQASAAYGRAMMPLLLQRGSYPMTLAQREATILSSLGAEAGTFDTLAVVRYRSRRDFLEMVTSPAFETAVVHKWASLENTLAAPASRLPLPSGISLVPAVLGGLALGAILARPRRRSAPA